VKEVFPKHDGTSEALEEPLADKDIQEPTTPEGQYVRTGAAVGTGYGHPAEDSQELSETTSKVLAETDLNATKTQDISSLGTKATEEQPWGQASTAPLSEPEDHALALAKPPADKPAAEESCHDRGAFMEDTVGERTLAQGHMAPLSDEALEERISAFEQDLAMACPVCSRGKIEKKDTAKGKSFYVCNQEACVFVSWGKPFHLECPRCKNPFLIQATAKAGETVLRCPRATCRYQQGMPEQKTSSPAQAPATAHGPTTTTRKVRRSGKKKRVVRRRVVRKKR
jgi:ssDNA-binding Zn-finger/Zn-ribbon topoisomerase 1